MFETAEKTEEAPKAVSTLLNESEDLKARLAKLQDVAKNDATIEKKSSKLENSTAADLLAQLNDLMSDSDEHPIEKESEETPKRKLSVEKPPKKLNEDKPLRKLSEEKPKRKLSSEKPPKKVNEDKPLPRISEEKPKRKVSEDKPKQKVSEDKPLTRRKESDHVEFKLPRKESTSRAQTKARLSISQKGSQQAKTQKKRKSKVTF